MFFSVFNTCQNQVRTIDLFTDILIFLAIQIFENFRKTIFVKKKFKKKSTKSINHSLSNNIFEKAKKVVDVHEAHPLKHLLCYEIPFLPWTKIVASDEQYFFGMYSFILLLK